MEDKQEFLAMKEEISVLNSLLSKHVKYFRTSNVIVRGMLYGLFTAIGATLGFTLFLVGLATFLKGASAVPLLDRILEETKLDQIIEQQLNNSNPTPIPTATASPSPTPIVVTATPSITPSPKATIPEEVNPT